MVPSFRRGSRRRLSYGAMRRVRPGASTFRSLTTQPRFMPLQKASACRSVRSIRIAYLIPTLLPRLRLSKPLRGLGSLMLRPGLQSRHTRHTSPPPSQSPDIVTERLPTHSRTSSLSTSMDEVECADLLSRCSAHARLQQWWSGAAARAIQYPSDSLAYPRHSQTREPHSAQGHAYLRELPFVLGRRQNLWHGYRWACQ